MTALLPIFAGPRRHVLQFEADAFHSLTVGAPDLIRWIEAKDPRAVGHWNELGPEEYGRAFTAARTAGFDVIDDLYQAFSRVMAGNGTEKHFAELVIPTLQAKGWLADADSGTLARRVQLIYDTNLRVARGAGQWDRVQRTKAVLPYLRAATARDPRVRRPPKSPHADHTAWDGIILPVDHPFWTRWWPPLGFRCRCTIIPMTRSMFMRFKGGITSDADLAAREARLGQPIFQAPGVGVFQQLIGMADASNDRAERLPELPRVNVPELRAEAATAWQTETAAAAVDALLDRLFG